MAGHSRFAHVSKYQRAIEIERGFGANVLDPPLPIGAEVVEAKAVPLGSNLPEQTCLELDELRRIDLAFEDQDPEHMVGPA
jgi:hypothetical protein